MKKRITSMLVAVMLFATACMNVGCGNSETAGVEQINESLTREQWIIGLGSMFGMSDYTTEEPFFDDVDSAAEVFPYLQACAEWGIFEKTEGKFEPQKKVTREFAIQTAVISAEVLETKEGENPFEYCVSYALNKGIITSDKKDYLKEKITFAEGQEILDWAVNEYQNREFVEYANVEINETVIDLTDSGMELAVDTGTVTVAEVTTNLQVGDIFIAPGNEGAPDGIVRKVTNVNVDEQGRQIIETVEPSLEEIYKELDFAVRAVPTEEDMVVQEGVTLVSIADCDTLLTEADAYGLYQVSGLGGGGSSWTEEEAGNGTSFGFEINFTKGTPKLNASWESGVGKFKADLEPEEPELQPGEKEAGKWFEKSSILYSGKSDGTRTIDKIENKFEGGYEITGEFAIKDLYVDVEAEPKKFLGAPVGVKSFSVKTHYKVESTLKLKGSLEEELKLTTFHIQTPVPGLTVKIEVMLYADANGELEVKFVATNCTTTSYQDGKVKKVDSSTADAPDVSFALKIEVGAAVKAAPCILGIELIDVKVKGGVEFNFEPGLESKSRTLEKPEEIWEINSWYLTLTGEVTAPVITLEVGKSSKCLLKLNMSWEIAGEDGLIKAPKHQMFKFSWLIGEDIMERKPKEIVAETQESTDYGTGILGEAEILDIDSYMVAIKIGESDTLNISVMPEGYSASDIYWECDDTSVATISGGTITGVGVGTTQVTVSTADGKYEVFCTVIVSDDTKVEFNAL